MASLRYQIFYRKYGVRLLQHVMAPNLFDLNVLELPLKSIYHYVTYDGIALGPAPDEYLFRTIKKPIFVGTVSEIGDTKGNPRRLALNEQNLLRDYRAQNRRIRPLRSLEAVSKDPFTLIVYNYCFIGKTYRYIRSFYTEYFKWHNTFAAVTQNLAKVAQESENQQFLLCGIPKILPSLAQLNLASQNLTQTLMKVFKEPNAYLLLELWKWLGEARETSLFNAIPKNKIHLINLIFQESGKWTVLNLGSLNSFRKDPTETEADQEAGQGYVLRANQQLDPLQIQKRFLKFMMTVMEARTVNLEANTDDASAVTSETRPAVKVVSDSPSELEDLEDDTDYTQDPSFQLPEIELNSASTLDQIYDLPPVETDPLDDETEETLQARLQEEDRLLDQELAQLNEIASKHEQETIDHYTDVTQVMEEKDITLEQGVMRLCDRLADDGLLTAGEYKRFALLSQSYKKLPSPYDKTQTLDQYMQIDPQQLRIENKAQFVDSPQVIDKSMLKSTLQEFDSKYIREFLPKHTTSMVLALQKAGVAVTQYEIEEEEDILGAYENHTVKLVPVEGSPSTIKFKIPKIREDGSYENNRVQYKMRKLRGDLPIRKVNYNRVALTSYYGKCFVNRGRKKLYDYGHWLQAQVMEKGLDKTDLDITQLQPANVFNPKLKAPRSYTALSMAFKGLQARGYTLWFDSRELQKQIPASILNQYQHEGNLVIGTNQREYLVLDPLGSVYTTENQTLNFFGTLEQFLNIPTQDAPVEFAELVVFGKEIPMGVVLAYHLGLSNLMKLLKVEPRRIEAGTRVSLGLNEYALVFSDETLVFSKDDRLASMILGGFHEYHRTIKLFSVYSFDKRGVYLNLLDANRLSVRYLREMDLMFQMFIDPITQQLLEEMQEPQTFQGLLFRACELLLQDEHPDELDPAYMRIKGYERIAGAVYGELIQALRVHNGSLGRMSKKIEVNPYAVWKKITEDPAKSQVSEINPIQALKEQEAVTYAGVGGRNKRSMTKNTRAYHPNDMGTISESTVDSSDVAINVFTSANPKFKSVLGLSEAFDMTQDGSASLLSTSALLAPLSDRDDPKRVA